MRPGYIIDQYGAVIPAIIAVYNYKTLNEINMVGFHDPNYDLTLTDCLVAVFRIKYKNQ